MTDYSKEMIAKAEIFAGKAHEGQMRKGGNDVPYIAHPIAVASILKANNATTEAVLGGLLHDVVEDTPVTLKEIGELSLFCKIVISISTGPSWAVLNKENFNSEKPVLILHGGTEIVDFNSHSEAASSLDKIIPFVDKFI